MFYKDAKSCVTNNRYLSDFFPVLRGVRQGCPLSTYLFIICIELLSYKITTTEDIKGITYANYEFKKSLFADDASFVLDGFQKSFETLVTILDNFSNISGLKLNLKKCQVLRIGCMIRNEVVYLKNEKGYFHLCPRMDFLQTLHINNSLYTNYENVFINLDSLE